MDDLILNSLKVIQLTDMHIFADDNTTLFDIKTNDKFRQLIEHIRHNEIKDTDLIVLTGDLSQDETQTSYNHIVNLLDPLKVPVYWIPGNHDDLTIVEKEFQKTQHFFKSRRLDTAHWSFIFLNTHQAGNPAGFLSETELNALQTELAKSSHKSIALVMHHHPVSVNTPLIDQYILQNQTDFWRIIGNYSVDLIMCGHVHQDYTIKYNQVTVESSPATCFQFPKNIDKLMIDKKIGYKVYQFQGKQFTAEARWSGHS